MQLPHFTILAVCIVFVWFYCRVDIKKLEDLANAEEADRLDAYLLEDGRQRKKVARVGVIVFALLFLLTLLFL